MDAVPLTFAGSVCAFWCDDPTRDRRLGSVLLMDRWAMANKGRDPSDPPLIFISHAGATDHSHGVIGGLNTELGRAGFCTYLDWESARQSAGEPYRDALAESLTWCDAALIVISPTAIESAWVKHETSVLVNRARTEPEFPLIPIFMEGATPEALKSRDEWAPHQLHDYQGLLGESPQLVGDALAQLVPLQEARATLRRRGDLFLALFDRLHQVDRMVLDQALTCLHRRIPPHQDASKALATELLLRVPAIEPLIEVVQKLAIVDPNAAGRTLDVVLPFVWLDESQAAALRQVVTRPVENGRGAMTNGRRARTCKMLIARACESWPGWASCEVVLDQEGDSPRGLLDATRRTLKFNLLTAFQNEEVSDQDIDRMIEERPCFLIVPPPPPDAEVITPVRRAFPHLSLFFHGTAPAVLTAMGLTFVMCLEPPVDGEVEDYVLRTQALALSDIGRAEGRC